MKLENKDKALTAIIDAALAPRWMKEELLRHVRSRSGENQACFRLGQMDMRQSVVELLRKAAEGTHGTVCATLLAAAQLVEEMDVGENDA